MSVFIQNAILWTLALYGLFEIIKTVNYYYTYRGKRADGVGVIITAKNQEQNIEGIIRGIMFKILYGKEDKLNKIILTDLNSEDKTKEILIKLAEEYECIDFIENYDLVNLLEK